MAVKHFKYFLEGRSFKIVTDQKSITRAILAPSTNLSPRQSVCVCVFPSSSLGWRYGMNGNSGSCRQPN